GAAGGPRAHESPFHPAYCRFAAVGFAGKMTLRASAVLRTLCFALLFAFVPRAPGQAKIEAPQPLNPIQAEREARALVAELLAQRPDQDVTNVGRLVVQQNRGAKTEVAVRFETVRSASNWSSIYETVPLTGQTNSTRLVVVHTPGQPNQYLL